MRVLEGASQSQNGPVRGRVARLEASLTRSERILQTAKEREKQGDLGGARILKKKSREEARMAMRLIGILSIEYGLDMGPAILRARRIVVETRNGNANGVTPAAG